MEHQPAIAANCEVDPLTMKDVEEAIVAQKARCTAKQLKQYAEAKEKVDQHGAFLMRKSKVDVRSCPKWKRVEIEEADGPKEPEVIGQQGYTNRLIRCPVCKDQVETAMMQLLTPLGFRYVSCSTCAKQRWSRGWLCECGVAWHTCDLHRIDPAVHRSAKPPRKFVAKEKRKSTTRTRKDQLQKQYKAPQTNR